MGLDNGKKARHVQSCIRGNGRDLLCSRLFLLLYSRRNFKC